MTGQAVSGMEAARSWSAASAWNVGRHVRILSLQVRDDREVLERMNRKRRSTVAGCAGGPARSSVEIPVMGAERRGRVIRGSAC